MRNVRHALVRSSACLALALTGCVSTTHVLEFGRDTYTVSATADLFRATATARQSVFETGAVKCKSVGKHFMLVDEATAGIWLGLGTTVDLTFRCLAEDDVAYVRPPPKP